MVLEEPLKCGCAVCCPLYPSCKIHANLSACICHESFPHLLQTALETLFLNSFHFVLQLPETRQLVRLRHFAHGTTALVFLTALSGKAISYRCPAHGLLLSALFSFWPGGDCKKNKTHCVLWENVIPFRALIFKIFPYWEVLSRQRCAAPPVCCCVISGHVSQRNSGSGCVLASGYI